MTGKEGVGAVYKMLLTASGFFLRSSLWLSSYTLTLQITRTSKAAFTP